MLCVVQCAAGKDGNEERQASLDEISTDGSDQLQVHDEVHIYSTCRLYTYCTVVYALLSNCLMCFC